MPETLTPLTYTFATEADAMAEMVKEAAREVDHLERLESEYRDHLAAAARDIAGILDRNTSLSFHQAHVDEARRLRVVIDARRETLGRFGWILSRLPVPEETAAPLYPCVSHKAHLWTCWKCREVSGLEPLAACDKHNTGANPGRVADCLMCDDINGIEHI